MIAHAVGVTPGLENWVGDRCEPSTGVQTGMWVAKGGWNSLGSPHNAPAHRKMERLLRRSTGRSGARRPVETVSLSSSSGMVKKFAAPLLRAQPVPSPVLPQSARAACSAFSPDVDANVCRWGDGLHS